MGVHFSSHTNSTLFTDCCGSAILDYENCCPSCGSEIPGGERGRWNEAMVKLYGRERVEQIREDARRKYGNK